MRQPSHRIEFFYMKKASLLILFMEKSFFNIRKNKTRKYTYFNNQLNAQILLFYNNMYVILQSSTCFEQQHAHLQEDKLHYHSIWYRHSL